MDAVVRSVITAKGLDEELQEMLGMMVPEGGNAVFDFGKILPEPNYDPADIYSERHRWRCLKWGCKDIGRNFAMIKRKAGLAKFRFDTPWGFPYPVFRALADKYRYLDFSCNYAEDNIGYNAGWNGFHWDHARNRLWEDEVDHEGSISFSCKVWGVTCETCEKWKRRGLGRGHGSKVADANPAPKYDNLGDVGNAYEPVVLSDWLPGPRRDYY